MHYRLSTIPRLPLALVLSLATLLAPGCRRTPSASSAMPSASQTSRPSMPPNAGGAAGLDDAKLRGAAVAQVEADIRFLASDELRGRGTGTPELERAGDYLVEAFRAAGVMPLAGIADYRSPVRLREQGAVTSAAMTLGPVELTWPQTLVPLSSLAANLQAEVVYVKDLDPEQVRADVAGKIVVTEVGTQAEAGAVGAWLERGERRRRALAAAGALALVEVYRSAQMPFPQIAGYLGRGGMFVARADAGLRLPHAWVVASPELDAWRTALPQNPTARLAFAASPERTITVHNVVGLIPGTDPNLARDYLAVTAHYDHIGVGKPVAGDSINNGARDNAMGTAALLRVARTFGRNPLPRPLLLIGWTAEEAGLLGSEAFAQTPAVPLSQIALNLNLDGAGYDDTTAVTLNGYGRTSAQGLIDAAVASVGLSPKPDPVPQYNLYHQSDNWSLAKRGVPAINVAPGFTGFSEELMRYYHQPPDHADALNFRYVERYTAAAAAITRALGNSSAKVTWTPGDELESVGLQLRSK